MLFLCFASLSLISFSRILRLFRGCTRTGTSGAAAVYQHNCAFDCYTRGIYINEITTNLECDLGTGFYYTLHPRLDMYFGSSFEGIIGPYLFMMVGSINGPYLDRLQKRRDELNLHKVYIFHETKEVYDFFALSDIFICASFEEAFPMVILLAMAFGLKIVTEALEESHVDLIEQYGDVIQIGARNMQNFSLLRRVGRSHLPVLLKRGLSATLDEWLLAAEYIMSEGNYNVVLCERGVRTFAQHTRNTLDLASIPAVRRISHLPVVVDPSHGTGKNYMVIPLACAGVAVGADGLIVEVHDQPEKALSDGAQALTLDQYEQLIQEVRPIHEVVAPQPATQ